MKAPDGIDYQLWARFVIGASIVGLIADRFAPPNGGEMFAMCIFFLLISLGIIPDSDQPPDL